MEEKYITVSEYVNHFGLIVLSGYSSLHTRKIRDFNMNRPGFELCGFFESTVKRRMVCLGNKEINYINSCKDKEQLLKSYDFLTNEECPFIIVCRNNDCPDDLLKIAKKKDFPILMTAMSATDLIFSTFVYLQESLAPSTSMHASLVEIYSYGVLILGESGIGKSETTLDLIKRGHRLVADDRVNISFVGGRLYGEAPEITYGIMEARGIGIIDIAKMFGVNAIVRRKTLNCVIKLTHFDPQTEYDRLGTNPDFMDILGHKLPIINLPVSGGRSISNLIEIAVTNIKLKQSGINSSFEFEKRMEEILSRGRDNTYDY